MARWIGKSQEQRAEKFLVKSGLRSIARNVTYRGSEIDLVMQEGTTWVCIEVKYRRQASYGDGAESIDSAKIRRMATAFQRYLSDNGVNPAMAPMRLDAIIMDDKNIQWIRNISA